MSETPWWDMQDEGIEFPEPTTPPLTEAEQAALDGRARVRQISEAEGYSAPKRPQPDGPVFTDLRQVHARDQEWLDKPYLPWGEFVTNNADGDTGKGLYAVHQAARVSRGEFGEGRMVVFAVAEDAFETVLKPRLLAAEANLEHVRCVSWRRKGMTDAVRVPDDVPKLEEALVEIAARMLVIDPLLSHLSAELARRSRGAVGAAASRRHGASHRLPRARQRQLHEGQEPRRSLGGAGIRGVHEHAAGRAGDGLRQR